MNMDQNTRARPNPFSAGTIRFLSLLACFCWATSLSTSAVAVIIDPAAELRSGYQDREETEPDNSPLVVGNLSARELAEARKEDVFELLSDNLTGIELGLGADSIEINDKLRQAATLMGQGNPEAAQTLLEQVVEQVPGHARANTLLGVAHFMQGNLSGAENILSAQATGSNADPVALKYLAATQLRMNQPGSARELLQSGKLAPDDPDVMAMLGIVNLAEGDMEGGVDQLRNTLEADPTRHPLRVRLAEFLIRQERFTDALAELDLIPDNTSVAERARELKIATLMKTGDLDGAAELAKPWTMSEVQDSRHLSIAAGIALAQEDQASATTLLERAIDADPNNVVARTYLANLAIANGDMDTANINYRESLKRQPGNILALKGIVTVLESQEDAAGAEEFLTEFADDHPLEPAPRLVLAEYLIRNRRFDEARPHVNRVRAEYPELPYARTLLASIHYLAAQQALGQRQWPESRAEVEQLLAMEPKNLRGLILLANVELVSRDAEAARTVAATIREYYPDQHFADELLGDIEQRARRFSEAATAYRAAWQKMRNGQLAAKMVSTHRAAGELAQAEALITDWQAIAPDNPAPTLILSEIQLTSGRQDEAVNGYERVLTQVPENPLALNNLAWLYQQKNDPRAEDMGRRALAVAPGNADVLDTLGWILVQNGKLDEGIDALEQGLALAPASRTIMEHLRDAYRLGGNDQAATELTQKLSE